LAQFHHSSPNQISISLIFYWTLVWQ
jgi:hypothetical protein